MLGTFVFEDAGISENIDSSSSDEYIYTVKPKKFTDDEITQLDANPFLLDKVSTIDFTTTNGISTASSSILLRQIRYNLFTDAKASYPLDGSEHTIHVRANFDWKIISVIDNGILSNVDELTEQTGSYNTTTGTPLNFRMAAGDASKDGKTATITFSDATGNFKRSVTITAFDALHVGRFGGKYERINGVWKFTEPLYVQKSDAENAKWASATGLTDAKSDTDGRQNTWELSLADISNYPAANECYQKNVNRGSADALTWYLPAKMQLMAIYAMNESFGDNKLETSSSALYWSATENLDSNSWFVNFNNGNTYYTTKSTNAYRVRCVREN